MASQEPLIRPPLQRRSQESLDRMMQAALEVLKDLGFEGFTLQEVSRRAGVSIGSIYARTASKDALILAIYERAMKDIVAQEERLSAASQRTDLPPRQLLQSLGFDMANVMLSNADALRVFMRQGATDPEIWQRGAEQSHIFARIFRDAVLNHRAELKHSDPRLAVDVAYRFVYCTLARRITHGPTFESARDVGDYELIRELVSVVADYLLGPKRPARAPRKRTRR